MTARDTSPSKRERTRTALLDAVDAIAVEEGVEAVTTTSVTRRCGVAVGTFYRYYPHRGAALGAAYDRTSERLHERWFAALGDLSSVPAAEAATRLMDSHVAAVASLPAWVPLLEAMRRSRPIAHEEERRTERALSGAFARRLGIAFTPENEVRLSVLREVTGLLTSRHTLAPPEEAAALRAEIERLTRDSLETMRAAR